MDESGKRIRTNADHGPVKDYDSYVFDIYSKYVPQPVDINTCSVYDKYDILEEIGESYSGLFSEIYCLWFSVFVSEYFYIESKGG